MTDVVASRAGVEESLRTHLWVGGGIVWDSDTAEEIEESWVKARPLLAAVGSRAPVPVAR